MSGKKVLELIIWDLKRQRRVFTRLERKVIQYAQEYKGGDEMDRRLAAYMLELSKLFNMMNHVFLRSAIMQANMMRAMLVNDEEGF